MARSFTLSTLVTNAKRYCDMENQTSISDLEWKEMISAAYAELYTMLVESGARYAESTQSITGNGSATYALPSDHLSTIGVDYLVSGSATGERIQLRRLMAQERNFTSGQTGRALFYALIGQNLVLYPTPTSGSYQHVYVPQPTDLSAAADGTAVDVAVPAGEQFLLWHAAVRAKTKEESELGPALAERERARELVKEWAAQRAMHAPQRTVVDDEYDVEHDAAAWRVHGW